MRKNGSESFWGLPLVAAIWEIHLVTGPPPGSPLWASLRKGCKAIHFPISVSAHHHQCCLFFIIILFHHCDYPQRGLLNIFIITSIPNTIIITTTIIIIITINTTTTIIIITVAHFCGMMWKAGKVLA